MPEKSNLVNSSFYQRPIEVDVELLSQKFGEQWLLSSRFLGHPIRQFVFGPLSLFNYNNYVSIALGKEILD
jgi:hypothetical protein